MQHSPESKTNVTTYGVVFLALAVFTAIEVAVSYLPGSIKLPLLLLLAAVKAGLVLLYFMHLRTDSRLYAGFFVMGLVLIVPLLLIMTLVMPGLFAH
jgi:cytochrome c oxidase subunit IV